MNERMRDDGDEALDAEEYGEDGFKDAKDELEGGIRVLHRFIEYLDECTPKDDQH
jgi:hypothetical protein